MRFVDLSVASTVASTPQQRGSTNSVPKPVAAAKASPPQRVVKPVMEPATPARPKTPQAGKPAAAAPPALPLSAEELVELHGLVEVEVDVVMSEAASGDTPPLHVDSSGSGTDSSDDDAPAGGARGIRPSAPAADSDSDSSGDDAPLDRRLSASAKKKAGARKAAPRPLAAAPEPLPPTKEESARLDAAGAVSPSIRKELLAAWRKQIATASAAASREQKLAPLRKKSATTSREASAAGKSGSRLSPGSGVLKKSKTKGSAAQRLLEAAPLGAPTLDGSPLDVMAFTEAIQAAVAAAIARQQGTAETAVAAALAKQAKAAETKARAEQAERDALLAERLSALEDLSLHNRSPTPGMPHSARKPGASRSPSPTPGGSGRYEGSSSDPDEEDAVRFFGSRPEWAFGCPSQRGMHAFTPCFLAALELTLNDYGRITVWRAISTPEMRDHIFFLSHYSPAMARAQQLAGCSAGVASASADNLDRAAGTLLQRAREASVGDTFEFADAPADAIQAIARLSSVLSLCDLMNGAASHTTPPAGALTPGETATLSSAAALAEARRKAPAVCPPKADAAVKKGSIDPMILHSLTTDALRKELLKTQQCDSIRDEARRAVAACRAVGPQTLTNAWKYACSTGLVTSANEGDLPLPTAIIALWRALRAMYRGDIEENLSSETVDSHDGELHLAVEAACTGIHTQGLLVKLHGADAPVRELKALGIETGKLGSSTGESAGPTLEVACARWGKMLERARAELGMLPPAVAGYGLATLARAIKHFSCERRDKIFSFFLSELSAGMAAARRSPVAPEFDMCALVGTFLHSHVQAAMHAHEAAEAGREGARSVVSTWQLKALESRPKGGGEKPAPAGTSRRQATIDKKAVNKAKREAGEMDEHGRETKKPRAGPPSASGTPRTPTTGARVKGVLTPATKAGSITAWTTKAVPGTPKGEGLVNCLVRKLDAKYPNRRTDHHPCIWIAIKQKCEPAQGIECSRCKNGTGEVDADICRETVSLLSDDMRKQCQAYPSSRLMTA